MARRIWLNAIWWYVYLSWQGSTEATLEVLDSENFSTDSILNLVERTGRNGTYVDVYRSIMYYYSRVPEKELESWSDKAQGSRNLFRTIMKLNTAKIMTIEPGLYEGGEKDYARALFLDAGVRF